jgi:uncharacterized protein DUF4154
VEGQVMMRWPRAILLYALLGLGSVLPHAHAQRAEATEASVKAAFLYKFAGYIEWPESLFTAPDAPFVMGVLGTDEVAADLARIVAGRAIGGHPVVVRRLKESESLKGVHFVFIGKGESARLASILRAAQQQGVLAVTENERGLEWGSAINFLVAEDRVGFEVSLDAAEKSGHRISSRMLQVARRVVAKSP